MWQKANRKIGSVFAGVAAIEAKRQHENKEKNAYADQRAEQAGIKTIIISYDILH